MDSPQKGVSPPCKLPNCTPGNTTRREGAADLIHFGGPCALNNLERRPAKLQGAQVCCISRVSAKARLTRRFPRIPIMRRTPQSGSVLAVPTVTQAKGAAVIEAAAALSPCNLARDRLSDPGSPLEK